MKLIPAFLCLLLTIGTASQAQQVQVLTKGTPSSIRGLSVVNDDVVWVSGSAGKVGRSIDGGLHWEWHTVRGYEKTEFRDIEAFDDQTALIMGIGEPAYILRTTDGGQNWQLVYKNDKKGMFLDAMEFWNEQSGIVIGDPIDGRFFIARTFDNGVSWNEIPEPNKPQAIQGEACFASSGTNVRAVQKSEAVFVSGGLQSFLHIRDQKIKIPLMEGRESTGANSFAFKHPYTYMVVGGDFNQRDSIGGNCAITRDRGKSWEIPAVPPHGYRSCVEHIGKKEWLTCGLNGVDYSYDDGLSFSLISQEGFHVCRKAKKGNAVFLAGGNGKIGKFIKQQK
ncbi:MAG TPA: oxidoreductase [Chitinophagaceae bacterium]|nr:oxidoreductase [Chitinophagaceae bacterium]